MNKFMKFRLPLILLIIVLLASCTPAETITPTTESALSTETPQPLPSKTPLPPTETPVPTPTAIPFERAQYTIHASLDYTEKTVDVRQSILYPNLSPTVTHLGILLAVEPNLWSGGFTLHELSVDGVAAQYTLEGQQLSIILPAPLPPNGVLQLDMHYTLSLPFAEQADPSISRPRIYGYTNRQVNLTNWYPFIVPFNDVDGWILHDPWYYGEHLVYEAADYDVYFQVNDPAVVVAASALAEPEAEWTHYQLKSGRAFVLSASTEFRVFSTQIGDVTVYSYYYPLYDVPGQAVLDVTARALELYSRVYGPYPHSSLSVVQGDFNDGMEYSSFYFQSHGFYNTYDGTAQNYLTFVGAHETAHQWFFENVASDQAITPWMDEMLCTYSERIYYETYHPEAIEWWWAARMFDYTPNTWVDLPIYENASERAYWGASYFHGAHFAEELRTRIGDEAFFAFLHDYQSQRAGQIATSEDFFNILNAHTDVDYSDLVAKYFRAAQ